MGLGPRGTPLLWKGEDLLQARSVFPHACAPLSAGSVQFHPLSVSIFRTNTLFRSYFFEQTCLFVETLRGIYILPLFPKKFNEILTSLHFIVVIICAIVLQTIEFVGVLRLRTASEERGPFYPGRRLSTILGTD